MTDKELIGALREDAEWAQANEWETPITLSDHLVAAADHLEALLAKVAEMDQQIQKEICKRVDVEAENEHLREATKMIPKWVSVDEQLPEEEIEVLTLRRTAIDIESCDINGYWYFDNYNPGVPVTHWMPLPSTEGVE